MALRVITEFHSVFCNVSGEGDAVNVFKIKFMYCVNGFELIKLGTVLP